MRGHTTSGSGGSSATPTNTAGATRRDEQHDGAADGSPVNLLADALTPGHSKTILATYLAGSPIGLVRALPVSLALSLTHVTMAVLIALLSLPLVSISLASVGRAPMLEEISRGLSGLIGIWMPYRASRPKPARSRRRCGGRVHGRPRTVPAYAFRHDLRALARCA